MAIATLKQFARTDGLLKGTALISNLISTACISILPGFGAKGLFIANTIQMTISGLLEVPTGYIADQFGWNKSVKLALSLKVLVTTAFLLAIFAARADKPEWIWFFFTMEAVVDSFAQAFLSGAYQAAYLNWYQKRIQAEGGAPESAPPLFLSSFQYALRIRFLLPLVVIAIVLGLQVLARNYSAIGPYTVAFTSLGFIFVLRFVVLFKVHNDLRNLDDKAERSGTRPGFVKSAKVWLDCLKSPYFPIYASSVAISMFAIFFLIAQAFKLFNSTGIASTLVWSAGILFGISIYLVRTLLGVLVFPRLGRYSRLRILIGVSVFLGSILLLGGALITLKPGFGLEFATLLILAIASAVSTDAIQRQVDSRLDAITEPEYRATWLSIANGCGMLLFGVLSLQILIFGLDQLALGFFSVSFFLICVLSAIRLARVVEKDRPLPSFSSAMGQLFTKSTAIIIAVFALVDIINFSFGAMKIQRTNELTVSRLVLDAVEEPLLQGSFVEARRRLQRLKDQGSFVCAKIKAWEFSGDLCGGEIKNPRLASESRQSIFLSDSSIPPIGTVTLYFDRTTVLNAIVSRLLFSLLFFMVCAMGLVLMLRRLSAKIQGELAQVVRLVEDKSPAEDSRDVGRITVREFGFIAQQLKEMLKLKTEISSEKAMAQIATQVSHDIRSPLVALKVVLSGSKIEPEKHKQLIQSSIDRIEEITQTMLASHRRRLQELVTDEENGAGPGQILSGAQVSELVQTVVEEEGIQNPPGSGVAIQCEAEYSFAGLKARVEPGPFKRVVSNLVRNAVEAVEGRGRVTVNLGSSPEGRLRVMVRDNGKGIPKEVMPKLGIRGQSFGKANGNGLGIWYAKKTVEAWGGKLDIQSQEKKGTTIAITLTDIA